MDRTLQILGVSAAAQSIQSEIDCAARSDAKVLITGESGVGKEVVARLIHKQGARRDAPFIALNCSGIPDTLLASELFGHVRGSFTDAYRDKRGWLEQADGGTIFMDEIAEMSAQMQSLLLRFLENGEIQRVGSDRRATVVDVRIIAATNRCLMERVAAGEFREDFFYRLNVIHIEIPPLRERREDIPVMLGHFLAHFAERHRVETPRLSEGAAAQLVAAEWPGNVRQLRNIAERLVVRARAGLIATKDLPREILSMTGAASPAAAGVPPAAEVMFERLVHRGEDFWKVVYEPFMARDITREDLRALIRQALDLSGGSYKAVARLLNVPNDDKRLVNFLRKYGCHIPIQDARPRPARVADAAGDRPLRRAAGHYAVASGS